MHPLALAVRTDNAASGIKTAKSLLNRYSFLIFGHCQMLLLREGYTVTLHAVLPSAHPQFRKKRKETILLSDVDAPPRSISGCLHTEPSHHLVLRTKQR